MNVEEFFKGFLEDVHKVGDYIACCGGEKVKVNDDQTLALSDEKGVRLDIGQDGKPRATLGNVTIETCAPIVESKDDQQTENQHRLDDAKKIFTRVDLLDSQTALLNLDKPHEEIVKILRPELSRAYPLDMGTLVIAATSIRLEDEGAFAEKRGYRWHGRLGSNRGQRGCMIYNLLRSNILQDEVLTHLYRLRKDHEKKPDEGRVAFLDYWDSILVTGYPSAYFVRKEDGKDKFFAEINWRFERGEKFVRVYSRTSVRNERAQGWCSEYAEGKKLCHKVVRKYQLGSTPALLVKIYRAE